MSFVVGASQLYAQVNGSSMWTLLEISGQSCDLMDKTIPIKGLEGEKALKWTVLRKLQLQQGGKCRRRQWVKRVWFSEVKRFTGTNSLKVIHPRVRAGGGKNGFANCLQLTARKRCAKDFDTHVLKQRCLLWRKWISVKAVHRAYNKEHNFRYTKFLVYIRQ